MFSRNSRYANAGTYQVKLPNGQTVTATKVPLRGAPGLRGYHRKLEGQRLDVLANHYLRDATAFWRLCDANGALSPDALEAHELIGIPGRGR